MGLGVDMSLKSRWIILNTFKYICLFIIMFSFGRALAGENMPSPYESIFFLITVATVVWFVDKLKPGCMKSDE